MIRIVVFLQLVALGNIYASTGKYRLTLRGDAATTVTIGWDQTSGSDPIVYYGTTDYGTDYGKYSSSKKPDRSISYKGMNNTFVRLTNLRPDTVYYFVIRDSQGTSRRLWFRTSPSDNSRISLIAGGDSRNNRTPRQNANLLVSKLKPNAVLFGGDMTDDDTNGQWNDWFEDWQLTISRDGQIFPIIAARGNHEDSNRSIYNLFDTPSTNVYYGITFGNDLLRVYTLNTEISISGDQTTWLRNDLTATKTKWKIAHYHKPMRPHTFFKRDGTSQYRNWAQLFYDRGMNLVVECDAHTVKSTWPIRPSTGSGNDEGFVRDNERGTVYVGEGCWGAPLRSNNDNKRWTRDSGRFNQFKWIFIDQDKIETRTIKVDNAPQVGEVSDTNRFRLPSQLDVWNPANGSVVTIGTPTPTPQPPGSGEITVQIPIRSGADDVEENRGGDIYANSSDLELVYDAFNQSSYQTIGLRFQSVNIPQNAKINRAFIQFTADKTTDTETELLIALHSAGNSRAFSNSTNVSSRSTLPSKVTWTPAAWSSGQSNSAQRTPNLKDMMQQLVNSEQWESGNALSFVIKGQGRSLTDKSAKRVADAFEKSSSDAPKLSITYVIPSPNVASETPEIAAVHSQSKTRNTSIYQIYPNPFEDSFTLKTSYLNLDTNLSIELFTLNGRRIYRNILKAFQGNNSYTITPSLPSSGIYWLRIKDDSGMVLKTKKIIRK